MLERGLDLLLVGAVEHRRREVDALDVSVVGEAAHVLGAGSSR